MSVEWCQIENFFSDLTEEMGTNYVFRNSLLVTISFFANNIGSSHELGAFLCLSDSQVRVKVLWPTSIRLKMGRYKTWIKSE